MYLDIDIRETKNQGCTRRAKTALKTETYSNVRRPLKR